MSNVVESVLSPWSSAFNPLKNANLVQRILRVGFVERLDRLNDQVRVSNQEALVVLFGQRSVIVGQRIRKHTHFHVANLELDGERREEFGKGELVHDTPHRQNDIARAVTNLCAVGWNVLSQAKLCD